MAEVKDTELARGLIVRSRSLCVLIEVFLAVILDLFIIIKLIIYFSQLNEKMIKFGIAYLNKLIFLFIIHLHIFKLYPMIIGIGAICMTAALFTYDIFQKKKKENN